MTQSTALATTEQKPDAPLAFGNRGEIKAIVDRMRIMLPSATLADWQANNANAKKNLESALFRAAQVSVYYRLMPGKDVHIIPFGNDFAVDVGIESWQKAADRYCRMMGISYHVVVEPMPLAELKDRRGDDYEPEDRGAIAYVWRSDKAPVYEMFGGKPAMTKGYGVWRKKAQWNTKKQEWRSDPIQEHRTAQDVADRRAMKMALAREFSLDALLAATPAEEQRNLKELSRELEHLDRDRKTLMAPPTAVHYDDDGMLMHGAAEGHYRTVVVDTETGEITPGLPYEETDDASEEPADTYDADADFDAIPGAGASVTAKYAALIDSLTGPSKDFAVWCRNKHASSEGPATEAQYRYLGAVINAITGDPLKGSHYAVLEVLTGRPTNSDNPPGYDLAKALLDWLPETKGKGAEKAANPAYQKKYADCVGVIWQVIQSAE